MLEATGAQFALLPTDNAGNFVKVTQRIGAGESRIDRPSIRWRGGNGCDGESEHGLMGACRSGCEPAAHRAGRGTLLKPGGIQRWINRSLR